MNSVNDVPYAHNMYNMAASLCSYISTMFVYTADEVQVLVRLALANAFHAYNGPAARYAHTHTPRYILYLHLVQPKDPYTTIVRSQTKTHI